MCGCCVSECNSMEADPDFLGPAALAKGFRFVGDVRDRGHGRAARRRTTASTASGTARAATSATSAARRASIRATRSPSSAPSRSSEGIDHDMGAKHAKWFVKSAKTTGWLRETELVPKTQGVVSAIKEIRSPWRSPAGKVPNPLPPHVAEGRRRGARALDWQAAGPRRCARHRPGREGARARARRRARARTERGAARGAWQAT